MHDTDDLATELASARRRLEELTAEVASNADKLRRSQQRELRLLHAPNLDSLFAEMTAGLRKSYGLQFVSVVVLDPSHDIRHMLVASRQGRTIPDLHLVDALTGLAPQYVGLDSPWLGAYKGCDHQMLFPGSTGLASIAMVPLRHHGDLIGSINFGSSDGERFTRHHASDFLAQLGIIASFAIENAVNRARLRRSGFTDVLTGWHNRRYLQARLREEIARARREQRGIVCLMLDIDHFKRVNDTWGHAAGDAVLREVAQRVESQVRASDVAVRYGGEEFVILLPNTEKGDACRLAERIRAAVSYGACELPDGPAVGITVSIGIAGLLPADIEDDLKTVGESLIARADVALYSAKAQGRDRVAVEAAA